MKLKLKLIVPVVLFTLVSVGVTSFIVLSAVNKKEGLQAESLALSEVGALSQSLQLYSLEIKKALLHAHLNQNVMEYGPFLAVARLDNTDLTYKVSKFFSRTSKIKESVFNKKLQEIPLAMAGIKNQLSFYMMPYTQKSPYLLTFLKSKNSILVGFLNPHDLSGLFDSRQSAKHQIFVMANKVYAVAHPDKKYLGVNMDNHPLSRLTLSSKHQSGVRTLQTEAGHKDILSFDNVEGTNLTVGVNHSLGSGWLFPYLQPAETFMALLLLLIIGWGLFRITQLPMEKTLGDIKSALQKILRGEPFEASAYFAKETQDFVSVIDSLKESLGSEPASHKLLAPEEDDLYTKSSELDKNETFRNLSLNIASLFQRPLGALLGHLQMAKVESDKALIHDKIDLAQRDVRKLRAKLDNLIHAVSDKSPSLSPVLLMDSLNDLIREKIDVFNQRGIKISKNLHVKKYVRSQQVTLEKALSLIIDFFVSTFAEQIHREIQFDLIDSRNELILQITSNSTEFSVEDVKKLMDPFQHQVAEFDDNLSIAIAGTIIQNLQGALKIESFSEYETQKGLVFKIFLPLANQSEVESYFSSMQNLEDSLEEPYREELETVLAKTLTSDRILDVGDNTIESKSSGNINNFTLTANGVEVPLMVDSFSGFNYNEDLVENHFSQGPNQVSNEVSNEVSDGVSNEVTGQISNQVSGHVSVDLENMTSEDEEESDDFVMLRPPRASDIPPPHMEVTDPFQSVTLKKLKNKAPVQGGNIIFPESPASSSSVSLEPAKDKQNLATQNLSVKIRKPKVRGGH